jgi:hypothetical protein
MVMINESVVVIIVTMKQIESTSEVRCWLFLVECRCSVCLLVACLLSCLPCLSFACYLVKSWRETWGERNVHWELRYPVTISYSAAPIYRTIQLGQCTLQ